MSFNKNLEDFIPASGGAFVTLQEIVPDISQNVGDDIQNTFISSVVAIVAGLISTGLKDLFKKLFSKKKKNAKSKE